jgi:hypothetical protein
MWHIGHDPRLAGSVFVASVGQTLVRQGESRASKQGEGEPEKCRELLHASPELQNFLAGVPMSSRSSRPWLPRPSAPFGASHGPSSEEPQDPWRWSGPPCCGRDPAADGRRAAAGAAKSSCGSSSGRSFTPLNLLRGCGRSADMRCRRRDDNSRCNVQNVGVDSSAGFRARWAAVRSREGTLPMERFAARCKRDWRSLRELGEGVRRACVALEDHAEPRTNCRRTIGDRRCGGTLRIASPHRHSCEHQQRVASGRARLVSLGSKRILLSLQIYLGHRHRRRCRQKAAAIGHAALSR